MTAPDPTPPDGAYPLPEKLDFFGCASLVARIEAGRGSDLTFSASPVLFLGALAAEILLRAKAQWQADGLTFLIDQPSDEFMRGLTLLGIPGAALMNKDAQ